MPQSRTVYTISPSPDSTLALEIHETGLFKRKHLFAFEAFSGQLSFDWDEPLESALALSIDANSLCCRGVQEKKPNRAALRLVRFAGQQALQAHQHPTLRARSQRFMAKPLRGYVVEGVLELCGRTYKLKANLGFGPPGKDRLQIDADAMLSLKEVGVLPPASWLGLSRVDDQATVHALLWGVL